MKRILKYSILPIMFALCCLYAWQHPLFEIGIAWKSLPHREPIAQIIAIASIVAAALAAVPLANAVSARKYEWPLVLGIVFLAFISIPASIIGEFSELIGANWLRPPLGPLLVMFPALSAITLCWFSDWRFSLPHVDKVRPTLLLTAIWGTAAALLVFSVALATSHPPTGYDPLAFHAPLAVFLWREGNLGSFLEFAPDLFPLAHPGATHLWLGLLRLCGGEWLANLGQVPFALLGCAAVYATARRLGIRNGGALLGAGGFLLSPIVIVQSGLQHVDVAGSALLMASFALACVPQSDLSAKRLALIGLGLGLTVATRLSLIPCAVVIGAWLVGATVLKAFARQITGWTALGRLAAAGLAFSATVAPWWVRNIRHYGNPIYPANIPLLGGGVSQTGLGMMDLAFVPDPILWPIYPLLEPHNETSGFGALFVVAALPGLMVGALRAHHRSAFQLYCLNALVMVPVWWMLTRHEPRFLLPLAGLGFAFLPFALASIPKRLQKLGYTTAIIAVLISSVITVNHALIWSLFTSNSRGIYYDQNWAIDPVIDRIPAGERVLLHAGFTGESYPALYPLLGVSLNRVVIEVDTFSVASTESIISTMQKYGIRYAYIPASPEAEGMVESAYGSDDFELVNSSVARIGSRKLLIRRYLYKFKEYL